MRRGTLVSRTFELLADRKGPAWPARRLELPRSSRSVTRMTSSNVVIPSASLRRADCRSVRMPRFRAISLILRKSSLRSIRSRIVLSIGSISKMPVRPK